MTELSEELSCVASISDQPSTPEECLTILNEYVNSPRVESAHIESRTPRLTFATSEGAMVEIMVTSKEVFTVLVSFEDSESPTGRFNASHYKVGLDEITQLIGSSWTLAKTLRLWSLRQL